LTILQIEVNIGLSIYPRGYIEKGDDMTEREETCKNLITRLRRIEGQVRGLQRMIEEGKDCGDIVTQISAVRSALDKVGFIVLSHRMEECIRRGVECREDDEKSLQEAMKLFLKLS
jgi:DNA-binding FrmR family transcriptional regulator